ncbi:hypothetical protein CRUP_001322 [Coryphaenoides rupestris]|nr:hypothetical protein CRUP_001322 [Coryphaenoides rupestris]
MNVSAGTGVFLLSLMSIPISYLFNSLMYKGSEAIFFAGCTTALILAISARFLLKKKTPADPLFYVYAVCAFLSVVNLIIGLEQDNIIDGFMTFYLKEASLMSVGNMEPMWVLCSSCTYPMWWCVFGACFRIFRQPSTLESQVKNIQLVQGQSVLQRPLDIVFIIYLVLATAFCIFRGLVVLDCSSEWCKEYAQKYEPYLKDPSAYPKIQMLVGMLYSGPYYIMALYGLVVPGCEWMPDLTLVHSGALAQAQFAHIGASLHTRTPFSYRVPATSQLVFLLLNLLYGLLPQALCYRWKYGTHVGPLFFLHISYVVVCVWACFRIFRQPSTLESQVKNIQLVQGQSVLQRPLDIVFIIYLVLATAFCIFRGLVVLDCSSEWCKEYAQKYEPYLKDPSAYPKIQMLVGMLYSGPYYIMALYGLVVPGCEWMPDLTLVHSGALAQEAVQKMLDQAESQLSKPGPWMNPEAPNSGNSENYGTERDVQNCPFFLKTGACRFGDRCSRKHVYPASSSTLMIRSMFVTFGMDQCHRDDYDTDASLEHSEEELYENFLEFYHDVLPEFQGLGKVVQFKVSCNFEPHLRGNVYVQFDTEDQCMEAYQKFNGRWYAGKQLYCELCPVTRWKNAICGLFNKLKCPKGKHCNFLHVFRNPGNEFWEADRDMSPDAPETAPGEGGGTRSEGGDRSWRHHHGSRSPPRSERSDAARRGSERRSRRSHSRERASSHRRGESLRSDSQSSRWRPASKQERTLSESKPQPQWRQRDGQAEEPESRQRARRPQE